MFALSGCAAPTVENDLCEVVANQVLECGYTLDLAACEAAPDRVASFENATCAELAFLEGSADDPNAGLFGVGAVAEDLPMNGFGSEEECRGGDDPDVISLPIDRVTLRGDTAEIQLPEGQMAIVPASEVVYSAAAGTVLVLSAPGSSLSLSAAWSALLAAIGPIPVVGQIAIAAAVVVTVGILVYTYWDEITSYCTWLWESAQSLWYSTKDAIAYAYRASARTINGWFVASSVLTPATAAIGAGLAVESLIDQACSQRTGCWVFFKYANESDFQRHMSAGGILANSDGLTYITWVPLDPAEVVQNLFLGDERLSDRGDYVIMFMLRSGITLTPAVSDPLELTYSGGTLRFARHIDPVYAGPNPFAL